MIFNASLEEVRILSSRSLFGNVPEEKRIIKTSIIVKYVSIISFFSFLCSSRKHMLMQMKMKDAHPMTVCSYMTLKV